MYVVQKAVKPKYSPHRWQRIGECCEKCEAKGEPCFIEYTPPEKKAKA